MFTFMIRFTVIILIIVASLAFVKGEGGGNWGYQDDQSFSSPTQWSSIPGSMCGGRRQSPINIIRRLAVFWSPLQPLTITSSTSSKTVSLQTSATSLYLYFSNIWNFNFNGVGCLKPIGIHWHWGSQDTQGSEHFFDNTQFPIEAHLVTYNCLLYSNSSEATQYSGGLYVFSILYKIGDANPAIDQFMPYMNLVLSSGNATIPEIAPSEFLPKNLGSYYRYEGSLTTPPCTENVIWTVFNEIVSISSEQLVKFRSLQFGHPQQGSMCDNFRPLIPLQEYSDYINRVVYTSIKRGYLHTFKLSVISYLAILVAMQNYT